MRQKLGLTAVELLIGMVLVTVIMGAMASLFSGSRNAYTAQTTLSDRQQSTEAGTAVLAYEIGLAGYRGTDAGELVNRDFNNHPSLEVTNGSGYDADTITIRYYEDRWLDSANSSAELKQVKFSVNNNSLYRTDVSSTYNEAQELVGNISDMQVVGYVNIDGIYFYNIPTLVEEVGSLVIRLTYIDDSYEDLTISLKNTQEGGSL